MSHFKSLKNESDKTAEEFVKLFYEHIDNKRDIIHQFYRSDSKLIWNGNPLADTEAIKKLYSNLPKSTHRVECLGAHPLPMSPSLGGAPCIQVMSDGALSYGKDKRFRFNHLFVLAPSPENQNMFYIAYESFRLL